MFTVFLPDFKSPNPLEQPRKIRLIASSALLAAFLVAYFVWPGWRMFSLVLLVLAILITFFHKHVFRGLLILLGLLLLGWLMLQTSPVQNWLVHKASARLSRGLGTRVEVKHLSLAFFNKLEMQGVYVEDRNHDTLVYAGKLKVNINDWFFLRDTAVLQYVALEDATIRMERSDSIWNYQFIADFFAGPSDTGAKKSIQLQLKTAELKNIHLLKKDGWRGEDMGLYLSALTIDAKEINLSKKIVDLNSLNITEPIFSIYNYQGRRPYQPPHDFRDPRDTTLHWNPGGWHLLATSITITNGSFRDQKKSTRKDHYYFDDQDIVFSAINASFKNVNLLKDTISAQARLSAKERSGFEIKSLKAYIKWQPRGLEFNNLDIHSGKSHLTNYFSMRYNNFDDMGDFTGKVNLLGIFKGAVVHSDDIAYFAPELAHWKREILVSGTVSGTVANLHTKGILVKAGPNTTLNGDLSLRGLPNIDTTFIDFKSNDFRTTYADMASLLPSLRKIKDPRLDQLAWLRFKGNFSGTIKDFITSGAIQTGLGNLVADVHMKFPQGGTPTYEGKLFSEGFELGKLVDYDKLGNIAFNVTVKGSSFAIRDLQAKLNGTISHFDFNDYSYRNITVNGTLARRLFNGELHADDPNLGLSLNGLVDFSTTDPRFNFAASIAKANFKRLKLLKDDIDFNGNLRFDFTGDNIDDFLGSAKIYDASVFKDGKRISFDSLSIQSRRAGSSKSIVIESTEFDAALAGEYSIRQLPAAFQVFLNRYYPSYVKAPTQRVTNENFSFVLTTKNIDDYLGFIDKNLKGFNNSNFSGRINSHDNLFNLDADIPHFSYKNLAFSNTVLQGRGNLDSMNLVLTQGDLFVNDSLHFPGTRLTVNSARDVSKIHITTSANQTLNAADISGRYIARTNGFSVVFDPSYFDINGRRWNIDKNSELTLNRELVSSEGLRVYSGEQQVMITSRPSETGRGNDLDVELTKINIGDFTPFFIRSDRIEGQLNGHVTVTDPFGNMNVDANATAEQFRLNDDSIGKLQLTSGYSKASGRVMLSAVSENKGYNFDIGGFINTSDSAGTGVELTTHLTDKTNIHLLEHYLTGIFSHLQGYAMGDLRITGKGKNLKYLGNLTLTDASMMVDYTKCTYRIPKAEIKMQEDGIDFGTFQVKDELNNTAELLTGKLYHNNWKDMAFDFRLRTNRFLLLNTTAVDNKQFYGKAIGKASFSFRGPQEDMQMDIQGEPTDSTTIFLPISSSRVNGEADFLTWKVYGKEMRAVRNQGAESNLTVNLKMTANSLARVNMIIDEAAGDQISAVGHGILDMHVGSTEDLKLNGRLDIDRGDYNFSFQAIKRRFKLTEGESNYIQWSGDPYDADIHLTADYRATNVRFSDLGTNNNPALSTFSDNVKNYVGDVLVRTTITGKLKQLDFRFDIQLPPNSSLANSPDAQELLKIIDRDENERNKQSSLLIVFNSFGPLSTSTNTFNAGRSAFEGIFLNSISGIVSAQLSKVFSNVLQNVLKDPTFHINFNASAYSGTVLSDVAAQTQFLPDRMNANVTINKSYLNERITFIVGSALDFGLTSAAAANAHSNVQFLPDVTAQFKLTKDKRVLFNIFYRENRSYLAGLGGKQSRSGASVSYHREFETIDELFRKKKKEEKKEEKKVPDSTP